jgi:hypothetical protein
MGKGMPKDAPRPYIEKDKVGGSMLLIFFVLLFFPVLIVTGAVLALPFLPIKLPPALNPILPWRWGIVAAANLVLFLFLGLQSLMSFGLESQVNEKVAKGKEVIRKESEDMRKSVDKDAARAGRMMDKMADLLGLFSQTVQRSVWWMAVFDLTLLAAASAAMMYWLDQRRKFNLPEPRLEMRW